MDFFKNNNQSDENVFRTFVITAASVFVLAAVVTFFCFSKDAGALSALRWLLVIGIISLGMRSYLSITELSLWDEGFGLSYGLGFALSFFLCWFLSAVNITTFGTVTMYGSLVFLSVVVYLISYLKKHFSTNRFLSKVPDIAFKLNKITLMKYLWGYALFAFIFFLAFWVIGFNPTLDSGTENYMDLGFMTSIYRQQTVAPFDLWFSGEKLNYYYLGQAAAVYMCRLSFVTPAVGYSLMLVTFWASVFTMATEICFGVTKRVLPAIIGGVATAFAGNFHWVIYGLFPKLQCLVKGEEYVDNYWFPDGTVFIRTELGDLDNGKNEFPAYSAILGDLHAHVINIIFVLPLVALLLDYATSKEQDKKKQSIVLFGLLLGLFKGTNYWDFAIYFVITGAIVVFSDLKTKGFKFDTFYKLLIKAFVIIIISYVAILPFTLNFEKISSILMICQNHTSLYKLFVLWFVPTVITVVLIVWMYVPNRRGKVYPGAQREGLLALCLCTIGLIIVPEVLYVKDIYGEGNERFNTMFKLTYQAFVLFGIIAGIAAGLIGDYLGMIVIGIVILAQATYTPHALKDWMGNVLDINMRKGISNFSGLLVDKNYAYEMMAASIINSDERKIVNIMEGAGDSYSHNCALSVLTGACTVEGWFVHEWLWRDDYGIVDARDKEIRSFYESGDEYFASEIIDKYNIDYIFVGPAENERYQVNLDGFASLGQTVWSEETENGNVCLIRVNSR